MDELYNPLGAKVGEFIVLQSTRPALRSLLDVSLGIREIDELMRTLGGKRFPMADYILQGVNAQAILRMLPKDGDDFTTDKLDRLVMLPDGERPYDENLHKRILPTGVLEVREGEKIIATYRRSLSDPYRAAVRYWQENALHNEQIEYWDFARETGDGPEWYIVEMDTETGMFRMAYGYPVTANEVTHLAR